MHALLKLVDSPAAVACLLFSNAPGWRLTPTTCCMVRPRKVLKLGHNVLSSRTAESTMAKLAIDDDTITSIRSKITSVSRQ
eukprot:2909262-Karenia_brevis.AAC.1